MSQLAGPAVQQVLKPHFEGIRDEWWRTKLGGIELLSGMRPGVKTQLGRA